MNPSWQNARKNDLNTPSTPLSLTLELLRPSRSLIDLFAHLVKDYLKLLLFCHWGIPHKPINLSLPSLSEEHVPGLPQCKSEDVTLLGSLFKGPSRSLMSCRFRYGPSNHLRPVPL